MITHWPKNEAISKLALRGVYYEAKMLAAIKSAVPVGSTFVDVGAHVGNHTTFFAKECGAARVVAIEPQRKLWECLVKNTAEWDHVLCLQHAVGDHVGTGSLHRLCDDTTRSGCTSVIPGPGDIEIHPLDNIVHNYDMMKIDVEGYESSVVSGAIIGIGRCLPLLAIEVQTMCSWKRLRSQLEPLGYGATARFGGTPAFLFQPRNRWRFLGERLEP